MLGLGSAGCTVDVYTAPPPPVVIGSDNGPVIDDPSVVAIDDEPPPDERVYVYDPGYPPGVYLYGDYYWYNGYRYPRQVFIDRYVSVNIRDDRYSDAEQNREMGQQIEAKQRRKYARKHAGKPNAEPVAKSDAERGPRSDAEPLAKATPPKEKNKDKADKDKDQH